MNSNSAVMWTWSLNPQDKLWTHWTQKSPLACASV